jgi:hypothetical protein
MGLLYKIRALSGKSYQEYSRKNQAESEQIQSQKLLTDGILTIAFNHNNNIPVGLKQRNLKVEYFLSAEIKINLK